MLATKRQGDALILQPFPLWLFQRGTGEGPKLLLQTLRGEDIDWGMPGWGVEKSIKDESKDMFSRKRKVDR